VTFTLRDWQTEAVDRIRDEVRAGRKNILVVAPTGSGKTILATHIIGESDAKCRRSAFVVDRISLINQTSSTFAAHGLAHGVIQADHVLFAPSRRIQVCSQQTLARRRWPDADLIVVDEAHTVTETVKKRIEPRDTVTLGLTATPFTRGLGRLYDAVVNVTTTNRLIADGILSRYRIFAAVEPNMDGVRVIAGEFDEKETSKRALEVVGDVVAEYLKHGEGRKFICSAVDTAHVEELHRQFMTAGIQCATYTYRDRDEDRAETMAEFRKPDSYIRGLITVTAASKGFDVPDIGCVIMARPLRKSLAEHIQFFGRGLRSHPGKVDCLVLDHSGNSARFWSDWNEFFETGAVELDDGKKKAKPKKKAETDGDELVKCPNCRMLHRPMPFCPGCGHEYPKRQTVQHVPGTLKELVATGDQNMLRRELWPQVVAYVLESTDDMARAQRKAQAIYRELTGDFARARVESTAPQQPSIELRRKIKANSIRWAKGRKAAEARA
jgi:DNA repair protein RadD